MKQWAWYLGCIFQKNLVKPKVGIETVRLKNYVIVALEWQTNFKDSIQLSNQRGCITLLSNMENFQKFQNVCVKSFLVKKTPVNYAFSTTGAWSSELLLLVAMIPQELSSIRVAGVSVPNGISCWFFLVCNSTMQKVVVPKTHKTTRISNWYGNSIWFE